MTFCAAAIMLLRCSFGTLMCGIGVVFTAVGEILQSLSPLAIDFGAFMVTAGSACWGRTPLVFPESEDVIPNRAPTPPCEVPAPSSSRVVSPSLDSPQPTIAAPTPSYIFAGPAPGTGPSPFQNPFPSYFYQPPLLPSSPLAVYLSPEQLHRPTSPAPPVVRRSARPTLTVTPCSASEDELTGDEFPSRNGSGSPKEKVTALPGEERARRRQRARASALPSKATPSSIGATPRRTTPRATIE